MPPPSIKIVGNTNKPGEYKQGAMRWYVRVYGARGCESMCSYEGPVV